MGTVYSPGPVSAFAGAARNYEMAAVDCPSWEPERAVALIGNELHWAVAAEGNKTDYFINSAPLWKSWWASLLENIFRIIFRKKHSLHGYTPLPLC